MIVIPITWKEKTTIRNLPELLDRYHKHGGTIVKYDRVISVIVFSQQKPCFEWVSPHTTRRNVGFKHALWCFFLGWWSLPGLFWTPGSIVNNLMGGADITKFLTTPPPLPGQPPDDSALRELRVAEKRRQYVTLAFVLLLFLLVIIFCVIPYV